MRSEDEMLELILSNARHDDRIRAVILNGSRANPNAPRDIFQDFDVVYLVTGIASFKEDPSWIDRFGRRMILQLPDEMLDPPADEHPGFTYLMQFADGNRIDLRLFPVAQLPDLKKDSLSVLLLDKDGLIEPIAAPSERDYLPRPPTAKGFFDCCNEFWWVCPYVAKGLWREEILYAKAEADQVLREQLMKMLTWYVGMRTEFLCNPGKLGKHLQQYLEPDLWLMLEKTYSDASYDNTWEALFIMCELFRLIANEVADHFGFDYPRSDDERVTAHLRHVRLLPSDALEMY